MVLDACQQSSQHGRQHQYDQRSEHYRERGPNNQRVPFPRPELPRQCQRCCPRRLEEHVRRQRQRGRTEHLRTQPNKRNYQRKFKRKHSMVRNLSSDHIQPEREGHSQAKHGSRPDHGVDSDQQPDCDTPCQRSRRSSHAEQGQDRQDAAAIEPIMVNRRRGMRHSYRIDCPYSLHEAHGRGRICLDSFDQLLDCSSCRPCSFTERSASSLSDRPRASSEQSGFIHSPEK